MRTDNHYEWVNLVQPKVYILPPMLFLKDTRSPFPGSPLSWMCSRLMWMDLTDRVGQTSACDCLIRDFKEKFIKGLHCNIGHSNALWAELWEIYLGTKLVHQLSSSRVIFEIDSQVVVNWILKGRMNCSNNIFMHCLLDLSSFVLLINDICIFL